MRTGYGHVQPNMTIFINGTSGGGKGAALKLGSSKLDQCYKLVHHDFGKLYEAWALKKQYEKEEEEKKNIKKSTKKKLKSKKAIKYK